MSIVTEIIRYEHGGKRFAGQLAYDDALPQPLPLVTVSHAWSGRSAFEDDKAIALARLGYAGFSLDVYGEDVLGTTREEREALMQPLLADRAELLARLRAGVAAGAAHDKTDADNIAATGYCLGGLCALDLARSGDNLKGVVSLHGLFMPPPGPANPIKAKVLVLHGWQDPMATPDSVVALGEELTAAGCDWQLHGYGRALHSFTNPAANDPASGIVYNADAERRSTQAMTHFLAEIFQR